MMFDAAQPGVRAQWSQKPTILLLHIFVRQIRFRTSTFYLRESNAEQWLFTDYEIFTAFTIGTGWRRRWVISLPVMLLVDACVLVGDRNRLDIWPQPCFPSKFVVERIFFFFFAPFSTRDFVICALCDTNECGAHTKQTHTNCTFTSSTTECFARVTQSTFIEMVGHVYLYFLGYECDSRNSQNVRQSYCIFCSDNAIVVYSILTKPVDTERCVLSIQCLNRAH